MGPVSLAGAILWWIGLALVFLVVIPLVLALAFRVLNHLKEIKDYAVDVLEHGNAISRNLEPVPALVDTRDLVTSVSGGLGRYVSAVDRLL